MLRHSFISPYLPNPDFYTKSNKVSVPEEAAVISGVVPDMKTWEVHAHPHAPTSYSYQFFQSCLGLEWDFLFVIIAVGL